MTETVETRQRWEKVREAKTVLAVLIAGVMVALTLTLLVTFAVINYGLSARIIERQNAILCVLLVEPDERTSTNIGHCFLDTPNLWNELVEE